MVTLYAIIPSPLPPQTLAPTCQTGSQQSLERVNAMVRLYEYALTLVLLTSPIISFLLPAPPRSASRFPSLVIQREERMNSVLAKSMIDDEDTKILKRMVWVIEDDAMLLNATVRYLRENTDYEIEPFLAAEPCVKLLDKGGTRNVYGGSKSVIGGPASGNSNGGVLPSCIISDIQIPDHMSGLDFLEYVRDHPVENVRGLPFVLLTARGMTDDRIAGYQKGGELRRRGRAGRT